MPSGDDDRGSWAEIAKRAAAFMYERTVAFWGHHDALTKGEPVQYGSGVLLQIDNVKFILTAEHVMELCLKHGVSLFLGAASDMVFPVSPHVRYSKKGDIAILVISHADAAKIGPTKRFTRLSEILCDDAAETVGGHYCAFGYPSGAIYSWQFEKKGEEIDVEVDGPVTLDDQELMVAAALQGCGLAYVWDNRILGYLASGALIRCLDDWCAPDNGLFLYYPSRKYVSAGMRALIQMLKA